MKLFRGFSRVADDSTQYSLLDSDDPPPRRRTTFLSFKPRRRHVPGQLPLNVGEEMQRRIVSAALVRNPILIKLLEKSAEVYGYEQKGVLRIPCSVDIFDTLMAAANRGERITPEIQSLLDSI